VVDGARSRHRSAIEWVPLARLATSKSVVHIADLTTEQGYIERHPRFVALVEGARARTMLLVPMLKEGARL
jgi:hypothetical protein